MEQATSTSLVELRERIDSLDKRLLETLSQRLEIARQVMEIKDAENLPLRDVPREKSLLRNLITDGRALGLDAHFITKIFHEVIAEGNRVQQDYLQSKLNGLPTRQSLRVAFQGIDGSYSHLAGRNLFSAAKSGESTRADFVGFSSFQEAVRAVENGDCDYAILPIENTTSGAINDVYDLLLNSKVSIVGEEKLLVEHCLVALETVPLSHLKRIYCSPLAVSECSTFLATIPECATEFSNDSATAVKRLQDSKERLHAAIASEEAAEMFGLTVLQRGISNQESNFTRYLLVAKSPTKVDSRIPAKTSIVMNTLNKPGALVEALLVFREQGINLTKLEIRPIPSNSWEEMFYIDFLGNLDAPQVKSALAELTKLVRFTKVLGCYPACDIEPTAVATEDSMAVSGAEQTPSSTTTTEAVKTAPPKAPSKDKGYTLVTRDHKATNTVIQVGGVSIGDGNFVVIAD